MRLEARKRSSTWEVKQNLEKWSKIHLGQWVGHTQRHIISLLKELKLKTYKQYEAGAKWAQVGTAEPRKYDGDMPITSLKWGFRWKLKILDDIQTIHSYRDYRLVREPFEDWEAGEASGSQGSLPMEGCRLLRRNDSRQVVSRELHHENLPRLHGSQDDGHLWSEAQQVCTKRRTLNDHGRLIGRTNRDVCTFCMGWNFASVFNHVVPGGTQGIKMGSIWSDFPQNGS